MLSPAKRLQLREILKRVSNGKPVSLKERLYLHKIADNDQTVANWLHQARVKQQNSQTNDSLDQLINDLALGSPDPESIYDPEEGDLGEWFKGAPSWLARS